VVDDAMMDEVLMLDPTILGHGLNAPGDRGRLKRLKETASR